MKIKELDSWEQYLTEIDKLKNQYPKVPIVYRGQPNSTWKLKTTLERFSKINWTIRKYCRLVINGIPYLKSSSYHPSNIPSIVDIEKELDDTCIGDLAEIPYAISYFWTYLRHHGFPSPLIDWSKSPFIAAFFAFCENLKARNVAIFAFIDNIYGTKSDWSGKPRITSKWLNEYPHERHNLQQSAYTIATIPKANDHQFARHEHVFKAGERHQDILIKFVLPSSERIKALINLDRMNINHFGLMKSDEALLRTLAFRQIEMSDL